MRLVLSERAKAETRTPQGVKMVPKTANFGEEAQAAAWIITRRGSLGAGGLAGACRRRPCSSKFNRQEGCSTSGPHKTGPKRNAARLEYTHER